MTKIQDSELFELVTDAMSKAYVPYSKFMVGAAIRTTNGKLYSGCNVENAAYPEGTCAEAGAISAMVRDGETQIASIYVMGAGDQLVTPCGGCRQRIREFSTPATVVHICGPETVRLSMTIDELLPFSFGPDNLR